MIQTDRSFWAWGRQNQTPTKNEVREYASFLETELGFPERPIIEPVDINDISLPEPQITPPDTLSDFSYSDTRSRIHRTYASSRPDHYRAIRGDFEHPPDIVAQPTTESEIRKLLTWASDERVAVVPYGGGTGVVGGTEPVVGDAFAGAISLDMGQMNQVLEVDTESRRARIQGGVLGPDLNDQLADHGVHLRHYPQSYEFSTLGGWIATRSGGHYATRYTHIDEFVESARMITPTGTFETMQIPASGAGPDPNRLIMGSEGALGVITEAWMQVEPRPTYRSDASVQFANLTDAVTAIRRISQAKLYPANCRLHDTNETDVYGLTDVNDHLVILGFESADHSTEQAINRALEICEQEGGTHDGPVHYGEGFGQEKPKDDEKDRWGQAFTQGSFARNLHAQLAIVGGTIETSVTWDQFHAYRDAMTTALQDAIDRVCDAGIVGTRFTHVYPDGPAPYITFTAAGEPGNEVRQHREIKAAGMEVVRDFDLTVTHHHAVGRDHMDWYTRERPDNYGDSLQAVKDVLDPSGIMNPGVLLN